MPWWLTYLVLRPLRNPQDPIHGAFRLDPAATLIFDSRQFQRLRRLKQARVQTAARWHASALQRQRFAEGAAPACLHCHHSCHELFAHSDFTCSFGPGLHGVPGQLTDSFPLFSVLICFAAGPGIHGVPGCQPQFSCQQWRSFTMFYCPVIAARPGLHGVPRQLSNLFPQFVPLLPILLCLQLGLAYMVFPGASHNRFEHSLGVAHLGYKFASHLWQTQRWVTICGCPLDDVTSLQILWGGRWVASGLQVRFAPVADATVGFYHLFPSHPSCLSACLVALPCCPAALLAVQLPGCLSLQACNQLASTVLPGMQCAPSWHLHTDCMYTCNLWCHLTSCYACVGCHRGELDIERRDLRLVGLYAAVLLVLHSAFLLPAAVRSTPCSRAPAIRSYRSQHSLPRG